MPGTRKGENFPQAGGRPEKGKGKPTGGSVRTGKAKCIWRERSPRRARADLLAGDASEWVKARSSGRIEAQDGNSETYWQAMASKRGKARTSGGRTSEAIF